MESHVLYEESGSIARVTLSRPEKLNALTRAMLERLGEIFEQVDARRDLRAVILSGEGEAFCAGSDIAELSALDEEGARLRSELGQSVCERIETCGVPVIGALWGAAAGGGCELALACHLRVASDDATFRLPELHLGLIPAYGGTQRLALAVGRGLALSAMLAGEVITAGEALLQNLINLVGAREEVLPGAERLARHIAETTAPLAVRACLEAVTRGSRLPLEDGLRLEAELFSRLFATEDAREGPRAFLEKRRPSFKGE